MNRFDRLNNQAPAQIQLEKNTSPVGRSAHDYSYIHSGNAIIGAVIPVDCFDVVPNEDLQINLASLLEFRNPTTRQLLNSCRVYFHAYYNKLTDLWEGARNFLDKGRSGKISLARPNLIFSGYSGTTGCDFSALTPMSLLNYLGLPPSHVHSHSDFPPLRSFQAAAQYYDVSTNTKDIIDIRKIGEVPDFFPADCCMAYQRNWRDFYANKNLLQLNGYWFPDNEEHFILSYDCENACAILYGNEDFHEDDVPRDSQFYNVVGKDDVYTSSSAWVDDLSNTPESNNPVSSKVPDEKSHLFAPNLSGLKFRQFRGDRFTTALPFPDLIRGDIPVIDLNQQGFKNLVAKDSNGNVVTTFNGDVSASTFHELKLYNDLNAPQNSALYLSNNMRSLGVDISLSSSITMSDIYTLETLTAFKRRMGMTNGDYNEMIEAQFGVNPHAHDRTGTYIGGYYQDFAFNSVVQTSESSGTPLGTKAGQGVSSGSGNIGNFHVPDYGWIQIYMMIVPDVMYTQGKPRMFSKRSNLEMYFPIFNNLPAQAIRNDELFISGSATTDSSPFGYEDRYAEYKSRSNRVSGFMGLSHSEAAFDSARIMARRFSSAPVLNSLFVSMVPENIDMEVFSVVDEPPIDFSVGVSIRRVFPGPYTAIEGSLSSPDLMR